MIRIFTFLIVLITANSQAEEPERNDFLTVQGKVVDKTEWPGDFTEVVAVAYDYTQEKSDSVVVDKRLHKGLFAVSPPLSKDQVRSLFTAITGTHTPWKGMMCDEPHHGFVFYDKNKAIKGSLTICFGCKRYRASPLGELSRHWDLDALEKLLQELEIPFSDDYTKSFEDYKKANKAEMATPRKPSD
jgi:hypothetical protein